jgi:hypothetical protein
MIMNMGKLVIISFFFDGEPTQVAKKIFYKKSNVTEHKQTHIGEKPWHILKIRKRSLVV